MNWMEVRKAYNEYHWNWKDNSNCPLRYECDYGLKNANCFCMKRHEYEKKE